MKILLTGATGFMGGNLLRMLAENPENEIFYLSRGAKEAPAALGLANCFCLCGDVTDYATVFSACKGIDIVYHVAAFLSSLNKDRIEMQQINVSGTNNLLTAALACKVSKFVHVSTVDAVGMEVDGSPATEKTHFNFDRLNNPYADTKRAAEQCVAEAVSKGLDAVIVNPSYMLGAWDTKGSSSRMISEIMQGNVRFAPQGGNSFVDVLDVCKGTLLAAEKGIAGERYILGGHNLSYWSFFTLVAKLCSAPQPVAKLPDFLVRGIAFTIEKLALGFNKKPLLTYNDAVFSTLPHYYSSQKAIQELGYQISPLEPAILRARDWFKSKH